VLFAMQNAVESPVTFPELTRERVLTEHGTAKFDLSLFAAETAEGVRLTLEYSTDIFEEATALRMLEHYRTLLEAGVREPECPIDELLLLDSDELEEAITAGRKTGQEYLVQCRHQASGRQAAAKPQTLRVIL